MKLAKPYSVLVCEEKKLFARSLPTEFKLFQIVFALLGSLLHIATVVILNELNEIAKCVKLHNMCLVLQEIVIIVICLVKCHSTLFLDSVER